jgi:ethanolamine utilization protein EutQ (cupin superfamily)
VKFRKKPITIEAIQYIDENVDELLTWMGYQPIFTGTLAIDTLEGTMVASPGDWIIKGVNGEFYPCKPDIFVATYEPA